MLRRLDMLLVPLHSENGIVGSPAHSRSRHGTAAQVTILDPKEDKPIPVATKGDEKAAAAARFAGAGAATATPAY